RLGDPAERRHLVELRVPLGGARPDGGRLRRGERARPDARHRLLLHVRPDRRDQRALQRVPLLLPEGRRGRHRVLLMRAALIIAAAWAVAGCSSPDPCEVGDPGQPLAIRAVVLDADLAPVQAADGARVALMRPPQGGRVLYAGVEAQNLDRCKAANLVGALRDPATHAVYGLEGRPVVLAGGRDGWAEAGEQQPSSYANVAVCPNQLS